MNFDPILSSVIIVIIGYPLGFVFHVMHRIFIYEIKSGGLKERKYIDRIKKYSKNKVEDVDYLCAIYRFVLNERKDNEDIRKEIDFLSSFYHALGSLVSGVFIAAIFVYYKIIKSFFDPNLSYDNWGIIFFSIFFLLILASLWKQTERTLDRLDALELCFVVNNKEFIIKNLINSLSVQKKTKKK